MKKLLISLLFLPLFSFGQTLTNQSVNVRYPLNYTPYAIIDLQTGDTLCWYWNSAQIKIAISDSISAHPSGAGTVTSITAGTGLSGGTITTSGTIAVLNPVYTVTVNLTPAQVNTVTTTPVTLIAAQGAGTIIVPIWAVWKYTFVTTPYRANRMLYLDEGGSTIATCISAINDAMAGNTGSGISITSFSPYLASASVSTVIGTPKYVTNTDLKLKADLSPSAAGADGLITVTIGYQIITP
jgi:hypothetical protein